MITLIQTSRVFRVLRLPHIKMCGQRLSSACCCQEIRTNKNRNNALKPSSHMSTTIGDSWHCHSRRKCWERSMAASDMWEPGLKHGLHVTILWNWQLIVINEKSCSYSTVHYFWCFSRKMFHSLMSRQKLLNHAQRWIKVWGLGRVNMTGNYHWIRLSFSGVSVCKCRMNWIE